MYPELEEYLFATGTKAERKDVEAIANLDKFANQLSYLNASVVSGRMSPKEAEKRVKDLYKQWKSSNKLLKE